MLVIISFMCFRQVRGNSFIVNSFSSRDCTRFRLCKGIASRIILVICSNRLMRVCVSTKLTYSARVKQHRHVWCRTSPSFAAKLSFYQFKKDLKD